MTIAMALGRWTANVRSAATSPVFRDRVAVRRVDADGAEPPSDSAQDASGPCCDDTAVTTLP